MSVVSGLELELNKAIIVNYEKQLVRKLKILSQALYFNIKKKMNYYLYNRFVIILIVPNTFSLGLVNFYYYSICSNLWQNIRLHL